MAEPGNCCATVCRAGVWAVSLSLPGKGDLSEAIHSAENLGQARIELHTNSTLAVNATVRQLQV
jgi:hypothetical protein